MIQSPNFNRSSGLCSPPHRVDRADAGIGVRFCPSRGHVIAKRSVFSGSLDHGDIQQLDGTPTTWLLNDPRGMHGRSVEHRVHISAMPFHNGAGANLQIARTKETGRLGTCWVPADVTHVCLGEQVAEIRACPRITPTPPASDQRPHEATDKAVHIRCSGLYWLAARRVTR